MPLRNCSSDNSESRIVLLLQFLIVYEILANLLKFSGYKFADL